MKYIVYRGIRHRDKEEYEYEEGKMVQTITIISKDYDHVGLYSPMNLKKKPSRKLIERMWDYKTGALFENTMENSLNDFHTPLFITSKNWNEREECIRRFEAHNTVEKILPGHYEF